MTKKEKIKFAYLLTYTIILIVGVVLYALLRRTEAATIILVLDIIFGVLGGIGFVILHNRITKYHCHHCGEDFRLTMMETLTAEDKGVEGRKTVCKNCNDKDYYKAVREKL